ncbi:pyridoxal kinase [Plasmodium gonderi]|uniref:pyridoxal kinase n=1 Tax=Plasmodium gonderi TaxID=77519 RepID=A0A1Y1JN88_PLAGO|nr:pyridoxal kinase [Plasmodium gonderi]GAW81863.1 pyridoxal kinase [Plasmodium gonderi]
MNNKMNRENIVSIQSQVFDGFCGNNVASFVLRRRGHVPKILNTVQYYSKYKHKGVETKHDEMKTILSEFKAEMASLSSNDNNNIHFLTGYIKTKECVEAVINSILELKNAKTKKKCDHMNGKMKATKEKKENENGHTICYHGSDTIPYNDHCIDNSEKYCVENLINLNFFWLCDPVLGDNGKLYVDKDVVQSYKSCIPFVDIITPNQFELELLCDMKISSENDVMKCILFLLNKGIKLVIVTSVHYLFDTDHLYLYVGFLNNKKVVSFKYKIFRFHFHVCGCGDLFASLLLSFILRHRGNILLIISKVLNILHNVIKNSLTWEELKIIENQDIIASDGLCDNLIKEEPVCVS